MSRGHDFPAIKQSYPLDEVIGKFINLKKQGRTYVALCPFHNESTPSFKFKEGAEDWECFGCDAHGDVVDFVAKMQNISISEAIGLITGGEKITLSDTDRVKRQEWKDAQDKVFAENRRIAIDAANRRWDRAKPIEGENPYLERKKIAPHNARTEGSNLLIPMWDKEGEIINVQVIPAAAGERKMFQKDCPTVGARFYVGLSFGRVIIAEGFATAASVYEAMGDRVCVAFSQGQMGNMAREMIELGQSVIIAADRKALSAMERLGDELGVPVIAPPDTLQKGDDFNDLMVEQGVEAVASAFRQGLIDYANRPAPPVLAPPCAISFVDAMDFAEADIPLRPWIVPGALLAGATHILAAPGGTGKSVFTLQMALMLASGREWAKWKPKRKCKVLIINAEDDISEQRRRMVAAQTVMGFSADRGQILIADAPDNILMSTADPVKKSLVATPLVDELVDVIKHHAIDVVIVDPFAETFDGDENSNGDTKWAMKIWRDKIARPTGCAVYLVHHTTKGSEDKAGSADVIRGGGAIVNSARLAATLFMMTKGEASAHGIKEDERFRYVRYDDAKSNNSLVSGRTWFKKVSVVLQNGPAGESDGGDEVGALEPWTPEGILAYQPDAIMALLGAMDDGYVDDDGVVTDMPFGRSNANHSKRWVGHLIMDKMGLDELESSKLLSRLIECKAVEEFEFLEPMKSRKAKGLRVDMAAARDALGISP